MTSPDSSLSRQKRRPLPDWLLPLALCCLASILILIPFFLFGIASGHDVEFHIASWLDVASQWKQGILYPRWTQWTNHGFGEPRFIFYPPLSWMLGAALTLVLPGAAAPMVYIVLTQTSAGLSAYFLLRRLATRRAAILGALFYCVNPDTLLMVYIRSDFAEQLACAFFPLLLLSALYVCELLPSPRDQSRNIAAFALLYTSVWLSNAPAGVIASYAMALLIVWAAFTQRAWRVLFRGGTALALGLGLAAFYIVPAAYEQRWVNISQALSSGLAPAQNFLFTIIDDPEHTWFNWIASICALGLILVFLLAALFSRQLRNTKSASNGTRSAFVSLFVVGAVAIALMLRFTLPLWDHVPKLRFIQFPWRCMSVVALIAACFLAALAERGRAWIAVVAILAVSIPLGWFLVGNTWWDQDEMATMRDSINTGVGFDGTDEYDPVGDDHMELPPNAPLVKVLAFDPADKSTPMAQVQIQKWTSERKLLEVASPAAARIALRLLNYPTWEVKVNGEVVQPDRAEDVNQMIVPVAPGRSDIQVRFRRTVDRTIGNGISLSAGFVALFLFGAGRKRVPGATLSRE
jgi:hypothetical protein